MTPYKKFLIRGVLPPNEDEARPLQTEGQLLHHPWWKTFQKRVDNTPTQMPQQSIGRLRHERTSRRDLWSPYRKTLPSHRSGTSWLLLANTQGRHPQLNQEMQMMSRICRRVTHSSLQPSPSMLPLALRLVGNEHTGTTDKGPRSCQVLTSHHWLLHQLDRSKTISRNYGQRGGKIHLKAPHLQVRPPIRHCHR